MGILFIMGMYIFFAVLTAAHWSFWVPVGFIGFVLIVYFLSKIEIEDYMGPPRRQSDGSGAGCLIALALLVFYILGLVAVGEAFGRDWAVAATVVTVIALLVPR